MIILKGQHLHIEHSRKGGFDGIALRDFDTDEEWYPIAVVKDSFVKGLSPDTYWLPGEKIPCRKSLSILKIL